MRTMLVAALLAALPAGAAEADVTFVQPGKFADARRDARGNGREEILDSLKAHLVERASQWLPAGEKLEVRITDIDMAGDFEPWTGHRDDIRVFREIDLPRVSLAFRLLAADGSVRKEGERRLLDPAYLSGGNVRSSDDPLRFEKTLLDRWLMREFDVARTRR